MTESSKVISLGVGPDVHLALVRTEDGWRLRVQVGDDEVADVEADLAALREFIFAAIDPPVWTDSTGATWTISQPYREFDFTRD